MEIIVKEHGELCGTMCSLKGRVGTPEVEKIPPVRGS